MTNDEGRTLNGRNGRWSLVVGRRWGATFGGRPASYAPRNVPGDLITLTRSEVMTTQTRLTRSSSDKVLGGVCGGLAQYFGLDPVIVRALFVALVFAGGMSVLLYPVLWLIM